MNKNADALLTLTNYLNKRFLIMSHETLSRALNERAAAQYIGLSVSFLQKDRMNGELAGRTLGPRYAKLGKRVVYLRDDLDAWLQAHLVGRNLH